MILRSTILVSALFGFSSLAAAESFKVQAGKVDFSAKSNAGFNVSGSADLSSGRLKATQKADELEIEELDVILPAKHFKTGMELRDEHLYDRVFKDGSGSYKDIHVSGSKIKCKGKQPTWECEANLATEMRGVSQELPYKLQIKSNDAGGFEFSGTTKVPTTKYGVEKITYMMIELDPDVEVGIKNVILQKDAVK